MHDADLYSIGLIEEEIKDIKRRLDSLEVTMRRHLGLD